MGNGDSVTPSPRGRLRPIEGQESHPVTFEGERDRGKVVCRAMEDVAHQGIWLHDTTDLLTVTEGLERAKKGSLDATIGTDGPIATRG